MIEHIRPEFTPNILPTYLGYHLQIFTAGRAKISLQTVAMKKHEFFASRPKKDRAAFKRQKARSMVALPEHYAAVDQILSNHPDAKVFRLHEKGNNNATADNAHLLASLEEASLWLVMSGVVHRWVLSTLLVHVLLEGKGKRVGEASIFNEYVPTQEHDWQDATFEMADYAKGFREGPASTAIPTALTAPRPSSKVALVKAQISTPPLPKTAAPKRPVHRQEASSQPVITPDDCVLDDPDEDVSLLTDPFCDYVQDDPSDDPIFLAEPPHDPPEAVFPKQQNSQACTTTSKGQSMMYGRDYLRAQLGI
jgi:hypothetical protein